MASVSKCFDKLQQPDVLRVKKAAKALIESDGTLSTQDAYIQAAEFIANEYTVNAQAILDEVIAAYNKKYGETSDVNVTGKEGDIKNAGPTVGEPGVPTEEQKIPEQKENGKGGKGLPGRQTEIGATGIGEGERNTLPGAEGLAGLATIRGIEQFDGQQAGTDGGVSGVARSANYDLRDKPNVALTPAKRRDINNIVLDILKKPVEDVTEAEKEMLRQ